MKNSISLVSMILMAIVMVIVLLLVARAWTSVAPTAAQIASPSDSGLGEGEEDEDAQRRPTLNDMRESTKEHAEQLEEARKQIDQ